jgi:predicted CXXCH cytochrome family protein
VRDAECRKCHDKTLDHVEKAHLALTQLGPTQRCGQCHEEHNAAGGSLVERSDTLCVSCHAHPDPRFGPLHVDPASAFVEGRHPLFKVTLPIPTAPAIPGQMANNIVPVNWKLERLPLDVARESSNLKFSHAQHLDVNQVQRRTDSKALGCSDCHVLAADGEHFAPITMATACSSCHPLTFDDRAPDRQLPHGKPRDAMLLIEDYYAHRFSDPSLAAPTVVRRRLPDDPTVEDKCTDSALACANKRAALEITNQFTRQGCISCHVVSDSKAPDVLDRFAVLPIRLVRDYFPKVHFNHKVHAVQKDLTGDAACLSCHKARDSSDNRVLMLPNLGKCLECHGESFAKDKIATPCTGCHAYHPQP